MTSLCITWHDTTQAITSHQMTWPSHDLTPQQTSRHQNTSLQSTKHHHHGTAEGSFTAKKWIGHRAGRSPCAHSIGKFFLCYILLFPFGNFRPRLVRVLLVYEDWLNPLLISPFVICAFYVDHQRDQDLSWPLSSMNRVWAKLPKRILQHKHRRAFGVDMPIQVDVPIQNLR